MNSKLSKIESKKVKSTTISSKNVRNKVPPSNSTIIEESVTTSIEEIQNGFLVTKNHSGRYKTKDTGDYGEYFDYDKKWFSEKDPIKIHINNKSVADAFYEENDD